MGWQRSVRLDQTIGRRGPDGGVIVIVDHRGVCGVKHSGSPRRGHGEHGIRLLVIVSLSVRTDQCDRRSWRSAR